jgi:D-tyrosyl-tRNA(Tyr) deacylase
VRAVLQRVSAASVTIDGQIVAAIGPGLLILVGVATGDTPEDVAWLTQKIAALRIFEDPEGKMNLSVRDTGGEALVVSQFTLIASTRKGTRPSFNDAARPETAVPLYEDFVRQLESTLERPVPTGRFGAMMQVTLTNAGPVTLVLDSRLRE